MRRPTATALCRHAVACLLSLAGLAAQAAPVSYTLQGRFTGATSGDASALISAGLSLFSGQSATWGFTLEHDASGTAATGGGTQYANAVHGTQAQIAGFSPSANDCPLTPSDFICAAHVRDGTGFPGTGMDLMMLFPEIMSSHPMAAALGETRPLSMQLITRLIDVSGHLFDDEGLDVNLATAPLGLFSASLSLFALDASASGGFQRADFELQIERIVIGDLPATVPEPGTLLLVGLAAAAGAVVGGPAGRRQSAGRRRSPVLHAPTARLRPL